MRWIEIITERALAPIYHFTTFKGAKGILTDGFLRGTYDDSPVISATRDQHLKFYQNTVRFDLDTTRIRQKFKIIPHNYWPGGQSARVESEERIQAYKLPISYVTSITLMPVSGPSGIAAVKHQAGDEVASMAEERGITVIDKRGAMKPVVESAQVTPIVYHGTPVEFEGGLEGSTETWVGPGMNDVVGHHVIYFSSDKAIARSYGKRIITARLHFKNPMVVDGEGQSFWKLQPRHVAADAIKAGHDGVILHNIRDGSNGSGKVATTYVVFDPKDIEIIDR